MTFYITRLHAFGIQLTFVKGELSMFSSIFHVLTQASSEGSTTAIFGMDCKHIHMNIGRVGGAKANYVGIGKNRAMHSSLSSPFIANVGAGMKNE